MKVKLTLLVTILSFQLLLSQNYQTIEEVNEACATLGFTGNEDAEIAVDRILDQIGIFRNFTIQECPDINNAVAKIIESEGGIKERYILYDNNFFNKIDNKADSDWAAISILAHEIGHHLNGHALNNEGSNHKFELEADYFSGLSLAKMGASLVEAQSAIRTLKYEKATRTHPAKGDRLKEIERGWNKANGITTTITVDEEKEEEKIGKSISYFRKGEIAFQEYKYTDAIEYFNKAKDLGNKDAYYYLSICHSSGFGVPINREKGRELAIIGHDLGSIPATYELGQSLIFYSGDNKELQKKSAERLHKKNYLGKWFLDQFEKYKTPIYATVLGYMYIQGNGGLQENEKESVLWKKKAAILGDPQGQKALAYLYERGYSEYGIEKDQKSAIEWYTKAADNGGYAEAKYDLATYYFNRSYMGRMFPSLYDDKPEVDDYENAILWYKKASEQGHSYSGWMIGRMYYNALGVGLDKAEGILWFKKAARLGNSRAQEKLTKLGESW
jgi:TPR repeat protein